MVVFVLMMCHGYVAIVMVLGLFILSANVGCLSYSFVVLAFQNTYPRACNVEIGQLCYFRRLGKIQFEDTLRRKKGVWHVRGGQFIKDE